MAYLDDNRTIALLDQWEYGVLYLAASAIVSGVVLNFMFYRQRSAATVTQRRMIVDTFSMTLFFVAMFFLARFDVGRVPMGAQLEWAAKISGALMVLFAAAINLAGRVALGRHWSNQIEVIEGHRIVQTWPYNWSRHPLYGSLVIFGVGMGLLAANPGVVIATIGLFLPAMLYRARHEELLLAKALGQEYTTYQQQVPPMLPHVPEWLSRIARGILAATQVWSAWNSVLDVFLFTALLTLGLSFVMARDDFRLAYKFKPIVIILCTGLAWRFPALEPVLWLPVLSSVMSLFGQCPGTLIVNALSRRTDRAKT